MVSRWSRRQLPTLAILLVSCLLSSTALDWGLPAGQKSWAFDEVTPAVVRAAADRDFAGGWAANYPPLHYRLLHWTANGVQLISGEQWRELSYGQRDTRLRRAGRWLSVLMATLMIWGIYRCARLFAGRGEARLAALVAASCLPLTYYAKTANVDVPYLFWLIASLFFLGQTLRHGRWRDHLLLAVTAVAAVSTKDQAFAAYVPLPVLLVVASYRRTDDGLALGRRLARAVGDGKLLATAVAALVAFAVMMNLVLNWPGFVRHLRRLTTVSVSRFEVYPETLRGQFELAVQSVEHLAFAMSWPLLALSVLGVVVVCSRPRRGPIQLTFLLCAISYYLFFIAVIRHNFVRFLLPITLILALFAATALAWAWCHLRPRPAIVVLAGCMLLLALARPVALDRWMLADSRYAAESWVSANVPPGSKIRGLGRSQMLPRGLINIPWQRLHRRGFGLLDRRRYDYVVLARSGLWHAREEAVAERLLAAESAFVTAACFSAERPWPMPSTVGIFTNLDKLSPEICVLRRAASTTVPGLAP